MCQPQLVFIVPNKNRYNSNVLLLFGNASYNNKPLSLERSLYVVALLICQNTGMTRDEMMLLLWADDHSNLIKQRLRQLLYRTKQMPYSAGLELSKNHLRFTAPNDVHLFRTAIQERNWLEAIALYRGELLQGAIFENTELEEWFGLERASLSAQFRLAVLEQASKVPAKEAALLIEQAMRFDPLNEDLLKTLLEYARSNPEIGIRAYDRFAQELTQALQLEPSKELQALVKSLPNAPRVHIPLVIQHKLPVPYSAFLGRQAELEQIKIRLDQGHCRLLSIVGVGGIGKTRLSLEVATRFAKEAVFVDLARLTDHGFVPNAILESLGERPNENPIEHLKEVLKGKNVLLVLDNFEHVMPAKEIVATLLEHTDAQFIVTSRENLGLIREQVFELRGLPAPDTIFPLETQDAAKLFIRAAQHNHIEFTLDNNFGVFNRIYQAVEGTPLGLELAASWVRTLTLSQIATELEHSLDVLAVDAPDMPERHRSFAAVFTSSWTLLSLAEQTALAQLSVFQGGFDKDMAIEVTGANLTLLLRLVNKSLISRHDQRFAIHEMIRQYSQQKLSAEHQVQTLQALCRVALNLSEKWYEHRNGELISEWSKRLEQDHDNIRSALTWALQNDPLSGALICGYLEHFWYIRGHHREGLYWAQAFEPDYRHSDENRVRLLWTIISLSKELGEYDLARATLETYRALGTELKDKRLIANYEKLVGFIAHEQGHLEQAQIHLQRSLDIHIEFNNHYSIATCHNSLGIIAAKQGRYLEAKQHAEQALRLKRMIGDKHGISYALENLGVIAGKQGDYALEKIMTEEALRLNKELGDQQGIAKSMYALGKNALEQNQIQNAILYCLEAFEICCQIERRYLMIQLIHTFAVIAQRLGQIQTALRFISSSIEMSNQLRSVPPEIWFDEQRHWQEKSGLSPAKLAELEFETEKQTHHELINQVFIWSDQTKIGNKILEKAL
jgi:predicted ATPase/DNA-binding SARP family transcriptional activator/Tfp pilus assembly protein PilF